jgi:hypothetical protein
LIEYLERHGMKKQADEIRSRLMGGHGPVSTIMPPPVPPLSTYRAPVAVAPVAPRRGLDPWIPLAVQPAPIASPLDLMGQMLLLQQLAAARPRPQATPAPPAVAPAPSQPAGEGWMSGFITGVK